MRIAAIALTVGLFVTAAHQWLDGRLPAVSWLTVHTLLPVTVFLSERARRASLASAPPFS